MIWDKLKNRLFKLSQCWDIFGIYFRRFCRWLWRYSLSYTLYALTILFLLPRSTVPIGDLWYAIAYQVSPYYFDYLIWEVNALSAKLGQSVASSHAAMSETQQTDFVRQYMATLQQAQQLEAQIDAIYADPNVADPDTESASLRVERDALRAILGDQQLTTEAILEAQVTQVLLDEGFGSAGVLLPPVTMHFTQVPNLLVTSPRDTIALEVSLNVVAMPTDEKTTLETQLDERHDIATLIVPLGGIALYPAMLAETSSIARAVEVFAHEWLHHYLFAFPLGLHYFTGGDGFASETRIINETTADLFGKAMARKILERYYPDLVPPLPAETVPTNSQNAAPPAFDFGAAMNETRVTVDALLAEGNVLEAEDYMEERRRFFRDKGYVFRKINQAFFAFYGGYQGGAVPGIGGEDPIGPAVRDIWENSASPHEFVITLREITTREALLAAVEDKN